ncbi:MAG: hypothetical protein ACKPKO_63835, partial [Candidatus Fonsibacter sp.]
PPLAPWRRPQLQMPVELQSAPLVPMQQLQQQPITHQRVQWPQRAQAAQWWLAKATTWTNIATTTSTKKGRRRGRAASGPTERRQ